MRTPLNPRRDRGLTDAVAERQGEPFNHSVISVQHATDPSLAHVIARAAALGKRALADPSRIRGVKSLDVLQRQTSVHCQAPPAWLLIKEVVKRSIGRAAIAQPTHHSIEAIPEIMKLFEASAHGLPAAARDVAARESGIANDLVDLGRIPVYEFRAQLDRNRRRSIAVCEDPATNPLACFEDYDVEARFDQRFRGG
jgi:hypothetical protein